MNTIDLLRNELEHEALTTRKMLALVPVSHFDWAPHEKSMKLKPLSTHLAELPAWVSMVFDTEGIDFQENSWAPKEVADTAEILALFETSLASGLEALNNATEADLEPNWVMRSGEHVIGTWTKYETIRHAISQTIHHRAQLGVYLRLLNIPIPGSYGPSADEQMF